MNYDLQSVKNTSTSYLLTEESGEPSCCALASRSGALISVHELMRSTHRLHEDGFIALTFAFNQGPSIHFLCSKVKLRRRNQTKKSM